jgi:ABC-type branched-subunit amino acid transport system ATPase component
MTAMLNIKDLRAYYGQVQALHGLELALNQGSVTTLLGANGAGKTTTLRAICNMVRSTGGSNSTAPRLPAARPRTSSDSASPMCRRAAAHSRP